MGLQPIPTVPPPPMSELDLYRASVTPKRTTERLWFSALPVLLVFALAGLILYGLWP